MTAQEYIERVVKTEHQPDAIVLGITDDGRVWWHVHRDEDIPTANRVAILIKDTD